MSKLSQAITKLKALQDICAKTSGRFILLDGALDLLLDHEKEDDCIIGQVSGLIAENGHLKAQLEKYGGHLSDCATIRIIPTSRIRGKCTCGLSDAIKAILPEGRPA